MKLRDAYLCPFFFMSCNILRLGIRAVSRAFVELFAMYEAAWLIFSEIIIRTLQLALLHSSMHFYVASTISPILII